MRVTLNYKHLLTRFQSSVTQYPTFPLHRLMSCSHFSMEEGLVAASHSRLDTLIISRVVSNSFGRCFTHRTLRFL